MIKIFFKIKNRLKEIFNDFIMDFKNFSFRLAVVRFINNMSYRGSFLRGINKWSIKKKDEIILDYLSKKYSYLIDKYRNKEETATYSEKHNIWVCWLQGEENSPQIVRNCIDSIRKHSNNHDVIIINKYNYMKYVDIPNYILEKYEKRVIGNAHFADIIRLSLLYKYGGIWIDATVFCTKNLPNEIFNRLFFSCKSPLVESDYISNLQWTTFVLGGQKNSLFYKFNLEFQLEYWKKEERIIDYLFMDYVIYLGYKNIDKIRKAMDDNDINNIRRDELYGIFNEEFSLEKYEELINSETYLYKLSWREKFSEISKAGNKTFYSYFINRYDYLKNI